MSDVYRANRKSTDAEIIGLNSAGLSLATIASKLDCHPTTITLRLKSLKIDPADTRRAFMEDIYNPLYLQDSMELDVTSTLMRTNTGIVTNNLSAFTFTG